MRRTLRAHAGFPQPTAWDLFVPALALSLVTSARHTSAALALLAIAAVPLAALAKLAARRRDFGRATFDAEVRDAGISLANGRAVPRGDIARAHLVRHPRRGPRVRVQSRALSVPFDLDVSSVEEGRAIIRQLAPDGARAPLAFTVPAPRWAPLVAVAGIPLAVAGLAWTALCGALAAALVSLLQRRVVVGADGVALVGALRRERFIARREIARAEPFSRGVTVVLTSGERVHLRLRAWPGDTLAETVSSFVERVREAPRPAAHARDGAPVRALLAPSGRGAAEWIAAMRAVVGPAEGYRRAAVAPEQLWRVVEDAASSAAERAGAALALGPVVDASARARFAAAAARSASARLRVVLARAADARRDAELLDALDGISRDDERRRASDG